ncbi:MAG: hypothetical protein WAM09_08190 [Anaerolineales bacterium]
MRLYVGMGFIRLSAILSASKLNPYLDCIIRPDTAFYPDKGIFIFCALQTL